MAKFHGKIAFEEVFLFLSIECNAIRLIVLVRGAVFLFAHLLY